MTSKIAIVSTTPPEQCGIATYSNDLCSFVKKVSNDWNYVRVKLIHGKNIIEHTGITIENDDPQQFVDAADYIYSSDIAIVDIQHEFKIFGGENGENILIFLNKLKRPISVTLHTVLPYFNEVRERIFHEIIKCADLLFVFSEFAKNLIVEKYGKPNSKIQVIPHGVPSIEFQNPTKFSDDNGMPKLMTFISVGHLRAAKGYEISISALALLKNEINFKYFIVGADHPQNKKSTEYRDSLIELVNKLRLSEQVHFVNEFIQFEKQIEYIQKSDVCLIPYTALDQSSSGTLAIMVACGRPIVSTPFQFAKAYVHESVGVLSESMTVEGFQDAIKKMIRRRNDFDNIARYNYALGKTWQWEKVAETYCSRYKQIRN